MSWKKSLLAIQKILGLLVNTLTTDDKYTLLNTDTLTQPIQMQLSKKQKTKFVQHFRDLDKNLKTLKSKMTIKTDIVLELRTSKDVLR